MTPTRTIGKTFTLQDSLTFKITGIVDDIKENTDFNYDIFLSLPTFLKTSLINTIFTPAWYNLSGNSKCMIQLRPEASFSKVDQQLSTVFKAHPFNIADINGYDAHLQPLSDIHFNTDLDGAVSKSTLWQLSLLAILILCLAIVNYINLTTAISTTRAKEIGIRKSFGGSRKLLFQQFFIETTLTTILATILALILLPITLHLFSRYLPDNMTTNVHINAAFITFTLFLIFSISLVCGYYPAHNLSKCRPALILKESSSGVNTNKGLLRQILTVGQFIVAQTFLILIILMSKQISFVNNHKLGFKKQSIINFTLPNGQFDQLKNKRQFIQKISHTPGVENISLNSAPPIRKGYSEAALSWMKGQKKESYYHTQLRMIDSCYIHLFGLQLLAGRNISVDTSLEKPEVLINKSMMLQMGYQDPYKVIGTQIMGYYENNPIIVGVLKDFNTQSLQYNIRPTVLFADALNMSDVVSVKLTDNRHSWPAILKAVNTTFKSYYPKDNFKYDFLDDTIGRLYESDTVTLNLLYWATGMAIFISLLGLFGLVSFMANRRTKEIGIRKVLGASTTQIIALLSIGLIRLVFIATLIASPIAWILTHKWLESYAYKTAVSWWIFALSITATLTIAMVVLWLRTLHVARLNPASTLKVE